MKFKKFVGMLLSVTMITGSMNLSFADNNIVNDEFSFDSVESGMAVELDNARASTSKVAYAVEGGNIYFNKSTGTVTDADNTITSAVIPSQIEGVSVTSIGDSAFTYCLGLTSITIPDSVTSIGFGAFNGCSSLASITIPNSVTSIEFSAFSACSSLTSISIPDSVTYIGRWAFSDCTSLTSITIPNSVTGISDYTFFDCTSLTSVTIPNSVTSIGFESFFRCTSLTSITIPNSVTSIGGSAFSYCDSLTSITIPDSVTSIGNDAFLGCDKDKLIFYVIKGSYADTWAQDNGYKVSYDVPDINYTISNTFIYFDKGSQQKPYTALKDTEGTIDAIILKENKDTQAQINWSISDGNVLEFIESKSDGSYHTIKPIDSNGKYYSMSGIKFKAKSKGTATITASSPCGWSKSWDIDVTENSNEIPPNDDYEVIDENNNNLTPEQRLLKYSKQFETTARAVNSDIIKKLNIIKKDNQKTEEQAFNNMLEKIRKMYTYNPNLSKDEQYAVEKAIYYYINTMVNEGEDITDLDLSENETEIGYNLVKKIAKNMKKDKNSYEIGEYKVTITTFGFTTAFTGSIEIISLTNPDKVYPLLEINSTVNDTIDAMRTYCEQLRTLTKKALNYGVNSYIDAFLSSTGLDKYIKNSIKTKVVELSLRKHGFTETADAFMDICEIYNEIKDINNSGGKISMDTIISLKEKGVGDISVDGLSNQLYKKLHKVRKNVVSAAIDMYEGKTEPESEPFEKLKSWKKLLIMCPVDVYIYDTNGNEIGSIVDNEIKTGSDNIVMDVDGDTKTVYVLDNMDIKLKAVGNGYGTLSITEEQQCNGNVIGRENYYNMPVYPDDVFTKNIDGDSYGTDENNIYKNDVEIKPNEVIDADEDGGVTINATGENGVVFGSGKYVKGNPVKLNAIANDDYYFAGWYNGDKLLSTYVLYEFTATDNINIKAVFNKIDNSDITESSTLETTEITTEISTEATTSDKTETTTVTETSTEATTEKVSETTTVTESSTETTTSSSTEASTETTTSSTASHHSSGAGASQLKVTNYNEKTTATTETPTETTTSEIIISSDVNVTIGEKAVVMGDKTYDIDVAPYIQASSNSTLVPLRFVALAISGGNVDNADNSNAITWNAETKTATIKVNNDVIEFTSGSDIMIVNGKSILMENGVKAEITDGRMFVPFRALGDAIGVDVSWDADTKTAIYKIK